MLAAAGAPRRSGVVLRAPRTAVEVEQGVARIERDLAATSARRNNALKRAGDLIQSPDVYPSTGPRWEEGRDLSPWGISRGGWNRAKRPGGHVGDRVKSRLEKVMGDETLSEEVRVEAQRLLGEIEALDSRLEALGRELEAARRPLETLGGGGPASGPRRAPPPTAAEMQKELDELRPVVADVIHESLGPRDWPPSEETLGKLSTLEDRLRGAARVGGDPRARDLLDRVRHLRERLGWLRPQTPHRARFDRGMAEPEDKEKEPAAKAEDAPAASGSPAATPNQPSSEKPSAPTGSGAAPVPPAFTKGQRITAAAVLAAMAANAAFNHILSSMNEHDIKAALESREAEVQAAQADDPSQGFLFILRFTGGVDSLEGPTAQARFQGLRVERGHDEGEARKKVKTDDPDATYQSFWIPPVAPAFAWENLGVGKFADTSRIEFQRLSFAQLGGFSIRGPYPANLSTKIQTMAAGLRFHILRPPTAITYRGVRGQRETEAVKTEDRDVIDGRVTAMVIDGTPLVPVMAADQQTLGFFRADPALSLDDSGVVMESNVADVRWLRPEQIQMVGGFQAQSFSHAKEHPDWDKNLPFGKRKLQ
jgi:hypothetical protein